MSALAGAAFVLVAGAAVLRTAVATTDHFGSSLAPTLAKTHPEVIRAIVMEEVGLAAARGEYPPETALAGLEQLLRTQPLATDPFLVHGAIALRSGDDERAERLLLTARRRDPRDPAARYLLADLYIRTGRPLAGMTEMSVLQRLFPKMAVQLAPALADYALTAGASEHIVVILHAYPELKAPLMQHLASDARNVDLVLLLAEQTGGDGASSRWKQILLEGLIKRGEYQRAHDVWERLSGVQAPVGELFNPTFAENDAPPPFDWSLEKGSGGIAEAAGSGLQVLYYGRADLTLASQTLLLPPGSYRIGMSITGEVGDEGSLRWMVTCIGSEQQLLDLPLPAESGSRPAAAEFSVPAGCAAQRLKLTAVGREFPKEANFTISGLQLARADSQ